MSDEKDELPSEETVRHMLSVQRSEIDVRRSEIQARAADLDNQKEVALASLQAEKEDRAGQRETVERESTKTKRFIVSLVMMLLIFIGTLAWLGHADAIFGILNEALKYALGGLGGVGLTTYYFLVKRPMDS